MIGWDYGRLCLNYLRRLPCYLPGCFRSTSISSYVRRLSHVHVFLRFFLLPSILSHQFLQCVSNFVGEMKCWPYCSDKLCFSFVDSESTLGLTLSCASFLLFRSPVLNGQADLQRSKSLLRMRSGALFGGFLRAHNLACSYPQQN